MRLIEVILSLAVLASAGLAQAGDMLYADHPLVGKIWDMNTRGYLDEVEVISLINKSDVILLGEIHDNPVQHEIQQKLFEARIASGARPALMMEQLNIENQPELDHALMGSDRNEVLNNVYKLVKFSNAEDYKPLLAIAVDNKLPIIAANTPNQKLNPVIWRGYDAYDADELKRLKVEEVWNDKRQKYMVTHMGGAHCGQLRDELRVGLSRSQRLRDALMVDSAVSSIPRGVVAILGSSHARRDIGLPLYFAARDPKAHIISIAFIEVSPDVTDPKTYLADSSTGEAPFDVVWFTPRVERGDPCADFNMPDKQPPAAK